VCARTPARRTRGEPTQKNNQTKTKKQKKQSKNKTKTKTKKQKKQSKNKNNQKNKKTKKQNTPFFIAKNTRKSSVLQSSYTDTIHYMLLPSHSVDSLSAFAHSSLRRPFAVVK
jgi:hypothetical protein